MYTGLVDLENIDLQKYMKKVKCMKLSNPIHKKHVYIVLIDNNTYVTYCLKLRIVL